MSLKKKLFFYFCMLAFMAVLIEGFLWTICLVSPKANMILSKAYSSAAIPDDMLGFRPNPAYVEHDAKGFRNSSVPKDVKIVCIGDSQTYGSGVGVSREQAWPQQLEKMSGEKTYNMAFGSYGPSHYLVLSDEAMEMKPSTIIVTFYTGNDLYDVFNMVYTRNKLEYLKNTDKNITGAIDNLEKQRSLQSVVEHPSAGSKNSRGVKALVINACSNIIGFITDHSKIFGAFRAVGRLTVNNRIVGSVAGFFQHPFSTPDMVYDNGKFRTVFTVGERTPALDLKDIRIQEALRITLESLRLNNEKVSKNNINFYVLLIPTKELVFKGLALKDNKPVYEEYKALMANEESIIEQTKMYLDAHNIRYFEALPALRNCLNEGKQPYSVTSDGHPNAIGYEAIARLIYESMRVKAK